MDLTIITAAGRPDPHLRQAAVSVAAFVEALEERVPGVECEWVLACDNTPYAVVAPLVMAAAGHLDIAILPATRPWNEGPAATRNRALADASGRFIAGIDTDDRYLAEPMADLYAVLAATPDAAWAAGRITDIVPDGNHLWDGPTIAPTGPAPRGWFADFLVDHNCPPFSPCASIVTRDALAAVGGWDTSLTYVRAEDLATWARISRNHPGMWVDEQVYEYRLNPDSVTHQATWGPKNAENPAWMTGFVCNLDDPIPGSGRYFDDLEAHAALAAVNPVLVGR